MTRSYTRDVGMSKLATASMTFGSGEVSAANGTFASFVAGDLVGCWPKGSASTTATSP